ncbi:MAG TPA: DNA polymerase III subunit gamma/tau [Candidatus Saccharimonadales bacterium]|nr:DNA polymerase III subunit gamma/tau [Candidatus Saccharimonadales bacterium]
MGQALYRKYRSKSLAELVGQEHITTTLEKAIKSGRISHAYLLTGPRGVGKTSVARILAHKINNLPYTDDSSHIDIIEIDAASNRRIDEIRELREKVYVAPTSAKYKVYIIDEVHMLTKEAFNALLKTLEEPPAHVVFILATTDAHKLPETIISRTQRFTFKPVELDKVVDHLRYIAKTEKIDISDEALRLLAEHGEGSFRDSISLLDQASSHGKKIDTSEIETLLGIPPLTSLNQLVSAVGQDPVQVMDLLDKLYSQGYQAAAIAKYLGGLFRQQLVGQNQTLPSPATLELLRKLIEVPVSHNPERFLEIILLEQSPQRSLPATQSEPLPYIEEEEQPAELEPEEPKNSQSLEEIAAPQTRPANISAVFDENSWQMVLDDLKKHHNTLYGVIRMAKPDFSQPGKLNLGFGFAFHQKRINEAKNRQLLIELIQAVSGEVVELECSLQPTSAPAPAPAAVEPKLPPKANISNISNIFGGGELLES